jgi:GNAT superfamily N-acetyltransferase
MATVRALQLDDVDAVLPLIAGYQRFYGAEPDDQRNRAFFSRFVAPSDHGVLLGAWEGDRLVGFATIYWTYSSTRAADVALMNDLFVAPEERGTGAGRLLIEACAAAARDRGCAHLEWYTATDNEVAQRLYERMGAERSAWFAYELPL